MAGSSLDAQWTYVTQRIIDIPQESEPSLWPQCCIYKVPEILRNGNPEAYTPKLISIGPIHHGKPELKQMEQEKRRYFRFFLERLSNTNHLSWLHLLESYKDFLLKEEEGIRRCYSEKYPDSGNFKFVDVILLDSVFIMEWLLRISRCHEHSDDYLLNKHWLRDGILWDLVLLENQVPIFVLTKLYDTVGPGINKQQQHSSFLDLARDHFEFFDPQTSSRKTIKLNDWRKSKHFTDLIRYFYIPHNLCTGDENSYVVLKTATKLGDAGVSFERVCDKCLLDITFEKKPFLNWFLCLGCFPLSSCVKARFQIPQLEVSDITETILRNLIALEQCHYHLYHHHICSYVGMLDDLINSKEDVELLVEKGVITHIMSSDEEMATMINGLCRNVVFASSSYRKIIEELNDHYDNNWNRCMGEIRKVYFRDLWRTSTTIIGIAVFLFTVISFLNTIGVKFN